MEEQNTAINERPLEERLTDYRAEWTETIKSLSSKLKEITEISSLLNEIYIRRQECVEHISKLSVVLALVDKQYKREKVTQYNNIKFNSQLRYGSDAAIYAQIDVNVETILQNRDMLEIHIEAMKETLKTIDSIIYGIRERVRIYEIMNGMKF